MTTDAKALRGLSPEVIAFARANFYRQFTREHQTWMQVQSGWRRIEDYIPKEEP